MQAIKCSWIFSCLLLFRLTISSGVVVGDGAVGKVWSSKYDSVASTYRLPIDMSSDFLHHKCFPRMSRFVAAPRSYADIKYRESIFRQVQALSDVSYVSVVHACPQCSIITLQMSWLTARPSLLDYGIPPVKRTMTVFALSPTHKRMYFWFAFPS